MSQTQYKLMYFNARGAAEVARMLFVLGDKTFEDYRFKDGEWPGTLKGNADLFPLGQAPSLIVDGKAIPQSKAIARYLAREFKLYGADNKEAVQIDIVTETVQDITSKMTAIHFEKDEAKKATGQAEFKDNTSKAPLTFLNNYVKKNGGRFFVGKSATLADVTVYAMLDYIIKLFGKSFFSGNYPDLVKFHKGITDNSPLKTYIANRPDTAF